MRHNKLYFLSFLQIFMEIEWGDQIDMFTQMDINVFLTDQMTEYCFQEIMSILLYDTNLYKHTCINMYFLNCLYDLQLKLSSNI